MLRYWRAYMLDEGKGKGALRRHGEESLGWLGCDEGLKEGETELVCKMVCSTVVAAKVMSGLREASVREEAEETLGVLQGLLEVSRMSEDPSESMEECVCGVCLKWLRKESVERSGEKQVMGDFLQNHSLRVGDRGVIGFDGVVCSVTLNDLPSGVYGLVNEFLMKRSMVWRGV